MSNSEIEIDGRTYLLDYDPTSTRINVDTDRFNENSTEVGNLVELIQNRI